MPKIYTKNSWQDEIITGLERYNTREDDGTLIDSNIQIELATEVAQAGTSVTADLMNNIEDGIDMLDTKVSAIERRTAVIGLNGSTALTTSDEGYIRVPEWMDGWKLVAIAASCKVGSSSGVPTFDIKVGGVSMLTTLLTIDAGETDSATAATPAVIDTTNDTVHAGNQIRVSCTVAGTGVTWAAVELTFQAPWGE